MNLNDVKEIIKLIKGSDISELVVEGSGMKMTIRQGGYSSIDKASDTMPQADPNITADLDITNEEPGDKVKEKVAVDTAPLAGDIEAIIEVTAPMVGIFYGSPEPDAPPYIEKGDQIKKGDVLCIIGAIDLKNEIKSDLDGEVVEVLVENGHPLEFGQVLFRIKPVN